MDNKDRLIIALCALVRAERETRKALQAVVQGGQMSPEVLEAILDDPVPVVTQDDLNHAERMASQLHSTLPRRMA
jgi:hypothetical protein